MSKFRYESNKKKVIEELTQAEVRALGGVGEFIRGRAKLLAPVDDGNLRNSIQYGLDAKNSRVVVGTNVEYAPYLEFGTGRYAEKGNGRSTPWRYKDPKTGEWIFTRGQKPQPFMRPAAEDNKSEITKLAEHLLKLK